MSKNDKDLTQQLAEVNHALDELSPSMEPGEYLRRQKELSIKKAQIERKLDGKKSKPGKIDVTYKADMNVDPFFKDYDVSVELKTKDGSKKKKAMKMISSFSILFIIIAVLIVLTWILGDKGLKIEGDLKLGKDSKHYAIQTLGVLEIFESVFNGFADKVGVITFVLVIGGFITVVMASQALEGFSQSMVKLLKGKEIWALVPLMFFFSLCGTVEGFSEETLGFYLLLIPVMIMCGFDVFTGVIAILLGAGVGVLTSIVNPFVVGIAIESMGNGMKMGYQIAWRAITWVVFTGIAVAITMWYANRVKKSPNKSITFDTYEGDKTYFLGESNTKIVMDWRRKLTLVIFFLTFAFMIIYLVDWDAIIFEGSKEPLQWFGNQVTAKAPWLTRLMPAIGHSDFIAPSVIFLISSIVCGLVNGIGEHEFIKSFMSGASDMLSVCLIIGVAGGVNWVLEKSQLQELFVSGLSSLAGIPTIAKSIILFLIFIPLSFLIPSSTGFATAVFPLLGGVVLNPDGSLNIASAAGAIQAFSFAAGLVMLFSPTNGVVMGAIGLARMDYKTFLKGIMPIVGIFFVLSVAFLVLGGLLGTYTSLPAFGGGSIPATTPKSEIANSVANLLQF